MKIGLIDVDGKGWPNLALMRISAYHKACGDEVEWWWSDFEKYDRVYKSKIFSGDYTADVPDPLNVREIVKGGSGYCIEKDSAGNETYKRERDRQLPPEIEGMQPDYSIYPDCKFAISMTSRGCPRNCGFCHVTQKEGSRSRKVANVTDFWDGKTREIKVLDPNIAACADKYELFGQYAETRAWIDFTQGLDVRLLDDECCRILNCTKVKAFHFAWDNPDEDLRDAFSRVGDALSVKDHRRKIVYVLTNYENGASPAEHAERALSRIYELVELGYDPDVRVYDRPNAPKLLLDLQRWCNNRIIFKRVPNFLDYEARGKKIREIWRVDNARA